MTATSSAVAERTAPPSAETPPSSAVWSWPNAPKKTFETERPIARAIISVSSVPDAPTSIPLTISTFWFSTKPVAAAATPVNAFSSEITTGMSAPPIGRTNSTPNASAPTMITTSRISFCGPQRITRPIATSAASSAMLTICWPGYVIGRPPISSRSFANAIN